MRLKLLAAAIFLFLIALVVPTSTGASEGITELASTNERDYRCFATSFLMENSQYKVLIGCRNLIYPPQEDLFNYVVWATSTEDGSPQRLGELGVGKAEFNTKAKFSSLFVTTESNARARSPEGATVMRGAVQQITFLEDDTTPTPTPENGEVVDEVEELQQEEGPSTKDRLLQGLKRAGLVSILALVAVIGLVFVITRPKS